MKSSHFGFLKQFEYLWAPILLIQVTALVLQAALSYFGVEIHWKGIALHAFLLLYFSVAIGFLVGSLCRSQVYQRLTFSVLMTLLLILVLTIHALNYIGAISVGGMMTFDMVMAYVGNDSGLLNALGVPSWQAYGSVAGVILLLLALAHRFSPKGKLQPFGSAKTSAAILIIGNLTYGQTHLYWLSREPFHLFFYSGPTASAPESLTAFKFPRLLPIYSSPLPEKLKTRPLVLITVDALRADAMGVYGASIENTPFLSSMVRAGKLQRFNQAQSLCTYSYCALVGILASRNWSQLTQTPDNLPDVLAPYGYKSYFLLGGDHTHFMGLRKQFGDNIFHYRDGSTGSNYSYANDDRLIDDWLDELPEMDPSLSFLYIHYMSVHNIGTKHFPGADVAPESATLDRTRINGFQLGKYIQNYHLGIRQVDDHIKKVFAWLEERQWLNDAIVIITSDHGEYLGEYGRISHGGPPFEPATHIPLLVYDARQDRYPERAVSSQIDIAPTFLRAIGAPLPQGWSGIPLQQETERCAVEIGTSEAEALVGVVDGVLYRSIQWRQREHEPMLIPNSPHNAQEVRHKLESCLAS